MCPCGSENPLAAVEVLGVILKALLEALGQNLLARIFQLLEAADAMAPSLHHFSLYRISYSVTLIPSLLTRTL